MDSAWYEVGEVMVVLFVILLVYTLPSVITYTRDHKRFTQILLVNVLLGFLVIPWVWTFMWATFTQTGATNE